MHNAKFKYDVNVHASKDYAFCIMNYALKKG